MKIILFSNSLEFSAVSMQIMDLASFFQSQGNRVHVLSYETIDEDVLAYYLQRHSSLTVQSLDCKRWQLVQAVQRYRKVLKTIQADLVHCHLGRACIIAALSKNPSITLLATVHNRMQYFGYLTRTFLRILLCRFDGISAVSKEVLKGIHIKKKKSTVLRVIYNPIQIKRLNKEERQVKIWSSDRVSIGVANRFVHKKGYEYWARLVEDLKKCQKNNPIMRKEFEFWAAGEGPLKEQYQEKATLQDVHFLGFRTDLMEIIAKSDLMLYPTQDEGFGLLLYETLSMGVPILAQDLPVFRELLGEHSPWLVDFRNPQAVLDRSLQIIAGDKALLQRAKEEGLWIQERLSPEKIFLEYQRFYQDCLSLRNT